MNCKQFNSIPLEEVLAALGHLPVKETQKEAWYLNPFGHEYQASFKVDRRLNLWYLFSEAIGGTNTDLMQKYLNTTVQGVLRWASQQSFSSFLQQDHAPIRKLSTKYRIEKVQELQHPNLLQYLRERGLSSKIYPYVKEIWFTVKDKPYYALGFENRSGGWELRNPYYKGTLLSKDISIFRIDPAVLKAGTPDCQGAEISTLPPDKNPAVHHDKIPASRIVVVEGFMDALSFLELQKAFAGDILVLNSTALLQRALTELEKYDEINLFMDNDKAGKKCVKEILKAFPHAKDFSHIYSSCKDLNQYLVQKKLTASASAQVETSNAQKAAASPHSEDAEKQDDCTKETNRKTGLRRRM